MNLPELYRKANNVTRIDSEQIFKEYYHKMQWRLEGGDVLLDIGTGPGDVLIDIIYKLMPANFEKIVGSDISPEMVDYAKENFKSKEKCDFKVLDIAMEQDLPRDLKEQFDHVISFYCLHWVQNQRQAFSNTFKLLRKEGGDCLLAYLSTHPIFDIYQILSQYPKWAEYMKDVDKFIAPLQNEADPITKCSNLLKEVGFSDVQVELRHKVYTYKGLEFTKALFKSVTPYMDDLIHVMTTFNPKKVHYLKESEEFALDLSYDLVIIYAKK